MNAYEFTRMDVDFTCVLKARAYDANVVAIMAKEVFDKSGVNYKDIPDYKDSMHWFIETTMSCDEQEAVNWMKFYMVNSIAYGIQTKNLDWRTKFLAAYDIFNDLTKC